MAEDNTNTQQAGANGAEERTFTQAQLDAIVAREKAKATKGWFSADDMAAKDSSISSLTTERDTARADLQTAQAELESLKREKILIGKGVPAEDVEYYAFKIGKLVTDKLPFDKAVDEFFKENPQRTVRMSTGGSLGGDVQPSAKPNDKMNALIRGAFK